MNYSKLFPLVHKSFPTICHSDTLLKNKPSSKLFNIYIPAGRKFFLWFCSIQSKKYCFLIEMNNHYNKHQKHNNTTKNIIKKIYFKYIAFKDELVQGTGTLLYGTFINNEFVCLKVIYMFGEKYSNDIHTDYDIMYDLVKNYIMNPNINDNDFIHVKLPIVSQRSDMLNEISLFPFKTYEIIRYNGYKNKIQGFTCNFIIKTNLERSDCYELYMKTSSQHLQFYDSAMVNDIKTSVFLNSLFESKRNQKSYLVVEFSDDENNDDDTKSLCNDKQLIVSCLFLPDYKKWKPYSKSKTDVPDTSDKIQMVERETMRCFGNLVNSQTQIQNQTYSIRNNK